jgi:vancomycin resistance protein VanJ
LRRTLARAGWLVPPVIFLVWLIGQFLRDRWWLSGLCFYFPSFVAAATLAAMSVMAWRWRTRRVAVVALLLSLAPMLCVGLVENQWRKPPAANTREQFRLVHWNVFYGGLGWSGVRANLRDADADFYLLSEVPGSEPLEAFLEDLGPEFVGEHLASMAVLARGEVRVERVPSRSGRVTAFHIHWNCDGEAMSILAVDLPSSLVIARDPLLKEVRDIMVKTRPDIVVGDFNAPRRSEALADFPPGYRHAYDEVGAGWSYTWPVPAPLWAIDQCIVGPRVAPVDYQLRSTTASDHRMQVLTFGGLRE